MTTHETQPEMLETDVPATDLDSTRQPAPAEPAMGEPAAQHATPESAMAEPAVAQQATPEPSTASTASTAAPAAADTDSGNQMLFADRELSDFHSRWTEVQAAFVDDPRDCVQKADRLVSDVVDQLTSSFSNARSQLEEQWGRGEEVSTEDLRIALRRYRDFFERLLAV